ncbi:hypothetical protein [Paramuribaculum intestinale]|nr:hypothetical protein [Paramuribaculum intestinale]
MKFDNKEQSDTDFQRTVWDSEANEWYFSVVDVDGVLTGKSY